MISSRRSLLIAATLGWILFPACEAAPSSSESDGGLPRPRLSDRPVLSVGDEDSVTWVHITGIVRLSDGRLAVADGRTNKIVLLSAEGSVLDSVGGEGEGPGEFRYLGGLSRMEGDSLLALDGALGRATVFSADLHFGRTFTVPPQTYQLAPFGSNLVALVGVATALVPTESKMVRPPWHLVELDRIGSILDTLLVVPGNEEFLVTDDAGFAAAIPFYGHRTVMASNGRRLVVGTGDSLAVKVRDLGSGQWIGFSGSSSRYRALTAATLDAERQARSRFASPRVQRILDALPTPPRRPAYADIVVAQSGHVWLGSYLGVHERDLPQRWLVFGPDGSVLGSVDTPARFRLMDVSEGRATGVWRDDVDRELVRSYEVVFETGPSG